MPRTLVLALAVALLLAGCSPAGDAAVAPTPTPTAVWGSEEEALAAAVAVYGRYTDLSNEVGRGADPHLLDEVLYGEFLNQSVEEFAEFQAGGRHLVGELTFDSPQLVAVSRLSSPSIVMRVCDDLRGTDVIDADGKSVVAADRPLRPLMEVSLDLDGPNLKIVLAEMVARQC